MLSVHIYINDMEINYSLYFFATKFFNVHAKGSNFYEDGQILLGKKVMVGIVKCDDK